MMNNSVYASTARFDTGRALGENELRTLAPSIFATDAHSSRSDRFTAIPTIDVLRSLANEGFMPVGARQSIARLDDRRDYTKHMIRLRRLDGRSYQVGDNVLEVILKNANDGSSAYDLMAGMFRIRCMNSLVAQTSTIDTVKVRHSGDAVAKVIEGTYRVLGEAQNLLSAPADWSTVKLNQDARMALAEAAHVLRFGDEEGNTSTPIKAAQLLAPRRADDRADDLWTQFNVVQENVIRGGVTARAPSGYNDANRYVRGRRSTTRPVTGIDQDIKLNKALWILGERMKTLLSPAA